MAGCSGFADWNNKNFFLALHTFWCIYKDKGRHLKTVYCIQKTIRNRMKFRNIVLLAALLCFCPAICLQAAEKNAAYRLALESITSAILTGYVKHLADGNEGDARPARAAVERRRPTWSSSLSDSETSTGWDI